MTTRHARDWLLACCCVLPAAAASRAGRSRSADSSTARAFLFPQDAVNDPTQVGRRLSRARGGVRQAGAVDSVRRRRRRARQHARSGRRDDWRLDFSRSRRPRGRALSVRRLTRDAHARPLHARRRQAVHPLGQGRHRHADRSLRAARLPERRRHRVPGGDRRARGRGGRRARRSRASGCRASRRAGFRCSISGGPSCRPRRAGLQIVDARLPSLPRGSQTGVRWSHTGGGFESSLSFFDGFNTSAERRRARRGAARRRSTSRACIPRFAATARDAAVPPRWLTVKGEAAYFTSSTPRHRRVRALCRPTRAADRRVAVRRRLRRRGRDAPARAR